MSRRDVAIVAWHEVPWERATPKEPSRRVTVWFAQVCAPIRWLDGGHFDEKYVWD